MIFPTINLNIWKQAAIYEKDGYTEAALIEVAIGSRKTSLEEKLALGDWYLERGWILQRAFYGNQVVKRTADKKGI